MLSQLSDEWSLTEAAHLLNRAGFGGSPSEIVGFHARGRLAAVESLFNEADAPKFLPLPRWAQPEQATADRLEWIKEQRELRQASQEMTAVQADQSRRRANQLNRRRTQAEMVEARGWWFRRMLLSKAPLREKMTLFWHDHFATSAQKVRQPALLMAQNQLFRQHAFGSFKALTAAIVRDPAMMLYLDTRNSRKGMPNENFAREILELFTLGEGHYTEADVRDVARSFTGYRLNPRTAKVVHQRRQWDGGRKTIFGKSGTFDADGVVAVIFEQQAAAEILPTKLWEYFVEEKPSAAVVAALAEVFRTAEFRVEPVLRRIFLSREFNEPRVIRSQIKSPIQYLVQLLKQLEITAPPAGWVQAGQQQLGQVLFAPPNVAGWDWGKAWINTNTLLMRYHLAGNLTKAGQSGDGRRDGNIGMKSMRRRGKARRQEDWRGPDFETIAPRTLRESSEALVDDLMMRFFHVKLPDKQRDPLVAYAEAKKGVVFTHKEVGELCHLMLSTPYYQLC